jgi:hypothetical protein
MTIEESLGLKLSTLRIKKGDFRNDNNINWYEGGVLKSRVKFDLNTLSKPYYVNLKYRYQSEPLQTLLSLTTTPCNFGGERFWFLCPHDSCNKRCSTLFLKDELFICRECSGYLYEQQINPYYSRFLKQSKKADKLEKNIKRKFYNGKPTKKYAQFSEIEDNYFWTLINDMRGNGRRKRKG